jgi:hypothetical protein
MEKKDTNDLVIILITIIVLLVAGILWANYNLDRLKKQHKVETYELIVKDNMIIQDARRADSISSRAKDSLTFLLSAKKEAIIINQTTIYENDKKETATLSSNATDTLYNKSLQSAYKEYGYLLNTYRK